jgi:hypothetical protein
MIEEPLDRWEQQLVATARAFAYPPTPDLAQNVTHSLQSRRQRKAGWSRAPRLAWAAAALLVLFSCLLAVPSVRAQIMEFLQVGIVRIFLVEPTPTQTAIPPAITPEPGAVEPGLALSPLASPFPTLTLRTSVPELLGETSLDEASQQVPFAIQLPEYPEDLGNPDRVYLQDLEGQVLVLVWLDGEQPDRVRLSLHMYARGSMIGEKFQPRAVQETRVYGDPAVWAEGPYFLRLSNGTYDQIRLIEGHVLIWESGEITYRLETDLPLEEAVRVAESLQPLAPASP